MEDNTFKSCKNEYNNTRDIIRETEECCTKEFVFDSIKLYA